MDKWRLQEVPPLWFYLWRIMCHFNCSFYCILWMMSCSMLDKREKNHLIIQNLSSTARIRPIAWFCAWELFDVEHSNGNSCLTFCFLWKRFPGDWIHYDQNKNEQKRSAVSKSISRFVELLTLCESRLLKWCERSYITSCLLLRCQKTETSPQHFGRRCAR